jgi:hypothetical protein
VSPLYNLRADPSENTGINNPVVLIGGCLEIDWNRVRENVFTDRYLQTVVYLPIA